MTKQFAFNGTVCIINGSFFNINIIKPIKNENVFLKVVRQRLVSCYGVLC